MYGRLPNRKKTNTKLILMWRALLQRCCSKLRFTFSAVEKRVVGFGVFWLCYGEEYDGAGCVGSVGFVEPDGDPIVAAGWSRCWNRYRSCVVARRICVDGFGEAPCSCFMRKPNVQPYGCGLSGCELATYG